MKIQEVDAHAPSILPDGDWELVWHDEFDGTELDRTKWDYRLSMMGTWHPGWGEEGVRLDGNSNAVFTVYEKDGMICSSQLQTGHNYMDAVVDRAAYAGHRFVWPLGQFKEHKYLKKYGYFECRCKLQKMDGWWSAFWLQSPTIGTSPEPEKTGVEIDIMESFWPGKTSKHACHYKGYGSDHGGVVVGEGKEVGDDYHVYGVLWDDNGYTFYIDGVEDGHADGPVSQTPQFILISTEVCGYREKGPGFATDEARAAVGDEFIVDYVRVYDRK